MQYNFGNIEGLIEHFEDLAERKRARQEATKDKADKLNAGIEASAFEYAVMVLRSSDLINMILIPNTKDEISKASNKIKSIEDSVDMVRHSLFDVSATLGNLHTYLEGLNEDSDE